MKNARTISMMALAVCAATAQADFDWAVISTTGDPDPVTAFDLADPANLQNPLGFLDGNFNRGADFDSRTSFYYFVSTDTLNDPGDRGLWYWDNNVNTQLTTMELDDTSDGDAALSNDMQTFFMTINDEDNVDSHSLYAFTDLGGTNTLTEIGETGLDQVIGLAMDPTSGLLYGYDTGTDALYTISTADATTTLIGASGMELGAIGGMDFSQDGSTLLLSQGSDLFMVDQNTGALTFIADLGLNTSALSYRVPAPSTCVLAVIGATAMATRRRR